MEQRDWEGKVAGRGRVSSGEARARVGRSMRARRRNIDVGVMDGWMDVEGKLRWGLLRVLQEEKGTLATCA